MPGLLRGVARVAVASGTATAVSNRVSRRQAAKWGGTGAQFYGAEPQYEQAPPPPQQQQQQQPAPAAGPDPIERIKELAALRDQGVLTDAEFATAKAKLLGG